MIATQCQPRKGKRVFSDRAPRTNDNFSFARNGERFEPNEEHHRVTRLGDFLGPRRGGEMTKELAREVEATGESKPHTFHGCFHDKRYAEFLDRRQNEPREEQSAFSSVPVYLQVAEMEENEAGTGRLFALLLRYILKDTNLHKNPQSNVDKYLEWQSRQSVDEVTATNVYGKKGKLDRSRSACRLRTGKVMEEGNTLSLEFLEMTYQRDANILSDEDSDFEPMKKRRSIALNYSTESDTEENLLGFSEISASDAT
ncbi:hypothetical protein WH47_01299 [Habropoda laboriosa]|uniref:Uncharacterized protein n=1 Tax=Habropoda laboriosa TaxID=597456 RepID=A0A0L7QZC7_9HYME|nr:hypothetical protein WH47_01299 [Habropoda laboriosa]